MRAKDVVGKRIKAIRQSPRRDSHGDQVYDLHHIILEDDTVIYFMVRETMDEEGCIVANTIKPNAKRKT